METLTASAVDERTTAAAHWLIFQLRALNEKFAEGPEPVYSPDSLYPLFVYALAEFLSTQFEIVPDAARATGIVKVPEPVST